jgi:hypothetical protein
MIRSVKYTKAYQGRQAMEVISEVPSEISFEIQPLFMYPHSGPRLDGGHHLSYLFKCPPYVLAQKFKTRLQSQRGCAQNKLLILPIEFRFTESLMAVPVAIRPTWAQ